jgi:PAS domain S-box-containing protein
MATKAELQERIVELEAAQAKATAIYEISHGLNTARDKDGLLQVLARPAIEAGVGRANLLYVDLDEAGEPEWAEIVAAWDREGSPSTPVGSRFYLPEFPFSRLWMASPHEPQLIVDVTTDERVDEHTRDLLAQVGRRAMAVIPLTQAGRWVGLITLTWGEPHEFSAQEEEIYDALTGLAAPAVESLRLVGNLEQMVTERTTELRESEEHFRSLSASAPVGIFLTDTEGRCIHVNACLQNIAGLTFEGLLGYGWSRTIHPDDREAVLEEASKKASEGREFSREFRILTPQGELRWVHGRATVVFSEEGEQIGRVGTIEDITERKQAEEALRESEEKYSMLFNEMLTGLSLHEIILDDNGKPVDYRFLDVNPAFEKHTGLKKQDLVGRTVLEVLPGTEPIWIETSGEVALGGEPVHFEHYSSEIGKYYEVLTFCPRKGQFATLSSDVTERKKIEEELEKHRDHLEELVEERTRELKEAQAELVRQERLSALGQLTATVAHEIRNPLGTVRTAVFAVGDAIERDEMYRVGRALQLAERNILRCDNIIRELLDFTHDRVLNLEPTRVDEWLNALLDEVRQKSVLPAIPESIVCVRELTCGVEIPIDREHLRRAVINVVGNAADAVQEEGKIGNELTVSTHVVGDRLEIRVSDTGPGIPGDVLAKVFEPLFSTKRFGVGLGLPIVQNILQQHGGDIEIESRVGEGTTVTLWLPIVDKGEDK